MTCYVPPPPPWQQAKTPYLCFTRRLGSDLAGTAVGDVYLSMRGHWYVMAAPQPIHAGNLENAVAIAEERFAIAAPKRAGGVYDLPEGWCWRLNTAEATATRSGDRCGPTEAGDVFGAGANWCVATSRNGGAPAGSLNSAIEWAERLYPNKKTFAPLAEEGFNTRLGKQQDLVLRERTEYKADAERAWARVKVLEERLAKIRETAK